MNLILGSVYAGNIDYYSAILSGHKIIIDGFENFNKQSFRNRCEIAGANGRLNLIVPVKRKGKSIVKDIRIDNEQGWRKLHWKSIESAYRSSPYFEYFEHEFYPLYMEKKFDFLLDLNNQIHHSIVSCLKMELSLKYSSSYVEISNDDIDLRNAIHPKKNTSEFYKKPSYFQVFQDRMDHLPNLSVLDLLFNEGPMFTELLKP